jgi:hypothetical protein
MLGRVAGAERMKLRLDCMAIASLPGSEVAGYMMESRSRSICMLIISLENVSYIKTMLPQCLLYHRAHQDRYVSE